MSRWRLDGQQGKRYGPHIYLFLICMCVSYSKRPTTLQTLFQRTLSPSPFSPPGCGGDCFPHNSSHLNAIPGVRRYVVSAYRSNQNATALPVSSTSPNLSASRNAVLSRRNLGNCKLISALNVSSGRVDFLRLHGRHAGIMLSSVSVPPCSGKG